MLIADYDDQKLRESITTTPPKSNAANLATFEPLDNHPAKTRSDAMTPSPQCLPSFLPQSAGRAATCCNARFQGEIHRPSRGRSTEDFPHSGSTRWIDLGRFRALVAGGWRSERHRRVDRVDPSKSSSCLGHHGDMTSYRPFLSAFSSLPPRTEDRMRQMLNRILYRAPSYRHERSIIVR